MYTKRANLYKENWNKQANKSTSKYEGFGVGVRMLQQGDIGEDKRDIMFLLFIDSIPWYVL